MSYRPFRSIGPLLLAASAFSFGIANLGAQTAPAAPSVNNPSRVDIFMGYSYFGAHGVVKPAYYPYSADNAGAALSGAYYINKYVGGEILGFANPDGTRDGAYAGYAGPIFRAPMQNFTLFAHGLVGGVRIGGPNSTSGSYPYRWGPGLVAGGGMDYDLPFFHHFFGLRVFEADYRYIHVDYGPAVNVPGVYSTPGGRANLGVAELSTGILMHIGHILPPPPVTYACVVTTPTGTIYPGDVVTITGTPGMLNPKKTVTYSWTSDGGPVSGTSGVASVDTKTYSAGTYTVKGHVSEGTKPGEFADCSVQFTVTAFQPPTVGCSANPSTVNIGDPSTITASGVSPQNRPLTYSYSATAGSISGNTSTATLSTVGAAPGVITVTCNAVDDKGQTASQMTTVTVSAPAVAPVAVVTKSLCTISFGRDARRPARVDNEAKACLDDVALNAQRDPQAKLAITGTATEKHEHRKHAERMEMKLAEERAVNTKAYLVTDKGVDASRIEVFTSTEPTDSAATTLIPSGATLDTTGLTPVNETAVRAVPRTAPAHHHKKK
jgi:outer membrane protein OmpA-like peptidoglycan-associated protein